MKVIDLVNKKINNEGMPKKFKFDDSTFIYSEGDYIYEHGNISFFNDYCSPIYNFECFLETLNCEIEIIEEDKKIEKLFNCYMETDNQEIQFCIQNINDAANKINELIDEVNKLKDGNNEK